MSRDGRPVYSTGPEGPLDSPQTCGRCATAPCRCEPAVSLPPERQRPRVRRERGGRRGKTVTLAGPLHLTREDAGTLLRHLKQRCGTGGTLRRCAGDEPAFQIQVQGDRVDVLLAELAARGYPVKRSGG